MLSLPLTVETQQSRGLRREANMAQGTSPYQQFSRRGQEIQCAAPDAKNGSFFTAGGGIFFGKGTGGKYFRLCCPRGEIEAIMYPLIEQSFTHVKAILALGRAKPGGRSDLAHRGQFATPVLDH